MTKEYKCGNCGHEFEEDSTTGHIFAVICPECGEPVQHRENPS